MRALVTVRSPADRDPSACLKTPPTDFLDVELLRAPEVSPRASEANTR